MIDWCGRGGLGSRLLQHHNLVGCVFGGEWEDPDLRDSKELDGYFLEHFGKKVVKTEQEFWRAIHRGQAEAFDAGAEAIPDILTPAQAEKSTPL